MVFCHLFDLVFLNRFLNYLQIQYLESQQEVFVNLIYLELKNFLYILKNKHLFLELDLKNLIFLILLFQYVLQKKFVLMDNFDLIIY